MPESHRLPSMAELGVRTPVQKAESKPLFVERSTNARMQRPEQHVARFLKTDIKTSGAIFEMLEHPDIGETFGPIGKILNYVGRLIAGALYGVVFAPMLAWAISYSANSAAAMAGFEIATLTAAAFWPVAIGCFVLFVAYYLFAHRNS
ncbi:MAG: hypothetical protein AAB573_04820 [Patescibacteria group bacterium]